MPGYRRLACLLALVVAMLALSESTAADEWASAAVAPANGTDVTGAPAPAPRPKMLATPAPLSSDHLPTDEDGLVVRLAEPAITGLNPLPAGSIGLQGGRVVVGGAAVAPAAAPAPGSASPAAVPAPGPATAAAAPAPAPAPASPPTTATSEAAATSV